MHDCAHRVLRIRCLLTLLLGLALSAAGCSSEPAATAKRAPSNKNLKHIDEILKKGAAAKGLPGKGP